MHELSLYAAILPSQHPLLLSILAGLTSSQPSPIFERRLHFIPIRDPGTPASPALKAQCEKAGVPRAFIQETYRLHVVGDVSEIHARHDIGADSSDFERFAFRCEFKDFPEVPGKRSASSRVFEMLRVPEGRKGHMLSFMENIGYKYYDEMAQIGQRFTYGNVDIRILQTYELPSTGTPADVAAELVIPRRLLDPSGAYVLQALLLVGEDHKPEIMASAFDEMQRLKETLRGVIDLQIGDRLVMNTRLRQKNR